MFQIPKDVLKRFHKKSSVSDQYWQYRDAIEWRMHKYISKLTINEMIDLYYEVKNKYPSDYGFPELTEENCSRFEEWFNEEMDIIYHV